ncbi:MULTISPECIES: hypothetical protein [unclassified Bradyrhizobium]|uniref:hypothetical protein n=1 Tax=unclassified Bradyrhizobium TaxID=2631580 RepID=UPI0028E7076E|nr:MULTISPECIES: hypothetical protein [unclassified Bradyrhizobium]
MNTERAHDLLANLLERARASGEKVFLTSREVSALAVLLGEEAANPAHPSEPRVDDASRLPIAAVALTPVQVTEAEIDSKAMLCLDFGTSFSKAFVSAYIGGDEPELIDLPLGDASTGAKLTTPSELFIDGDWIYLGVDARRRWDDIQAPTERLIDSIKQFITLNMDVSTLAQRAMPPAQDPRQQFSQRDILVLYLAHLTALTERAVIEKGLTPNLRRRFTHPAWKDETREHNEREMRQLMAEAVVLARSAPAEFTTKMAYASARRLLDQLSSVGSDKLPSVLIGEPVREATAAGAGALLATREGKREAYLVLDIGAGTTDVAGFYCVNNPNNDRMRIFEVSSAADAKNVAGNTLDNALQRFVLDRSGLSLDSAEARLAGHALRRQVRNYKEQLFRTGKLIVELTTDQLVEVNLNEFLSYGPVMQFNTLITEMVARSAVALAGDLGRVKLVATGGGATLPIVRQLGENGVRHGGRQVVFSVVDAMSDDLRETHPDLIDPYPQIAVALGGSLPNLPEQKSSIPTGISTPPKLTLSPIYKS